MYLDEKALGLKVLEYEFQPDLFKDFFDYNE